MRVYGKPGSGMDWHTDDVLYAPPQIEAVLTIDNDSDCVTMWEEKSADGSSTRMEGVETEPNSILLVRAGGVRHKVTPLKKGQRVILKFVYVREGSDFVTEDVNVVGHLRKQFETSKKRGVRRKKHRSERR